VGSLSGINLGDCSTMESLFLSAGPAKVKEEVKKGKKIRGIAEGPERDWI